MQTQLTTLIAPVCSCCAAPNELLPRDDLAGGMAVCPQSGQLYQPDGTGYVATSLPTLMAERSYAPSIQIDLSRSSYA